MSSINQKIAIGAIWAVLTRVSIASLGLISTIILARLLFPEDFGLIALAMTILALFEIFSSFSFDINIIQKENVTEETLNSAWTCKVISGLVLATAVFLSSGILSDYFEDSRLNLLISVIAFIPIIRGLDNIGFVLFRKELNLKKEFHLEIIAKVISFLVTITSAYFLTNYWALVIGIYTNAIVRLILSFLMHPFRPKFSLKEAGELFRFSKWLLINNLLIFFNHKITDLVIGKQSSPVQLGYFSLAYEISNLPTTEIVFPLSRSIFPGYAKLRSNITTLKESFLKFNKIILFVAAPICFGMAATAEELVAVMLGDRWLEIIPTISLLAFYGLMRCAVQNTGSIYLVLNKPTVPVYFSSVRLILLTPLLIYIVPGQGAYGAAIAIVAVTALITPVAFFVIKKILNISTKELLGMFAFPLVASFLMYLLVTEVSNLFSIPILLLLVLKVLVGIIFYALATCFYIYRYPDNNPIKDILLKTKLRSFIQKI